MTVTITGTSDAAVTRRGDEIVAMQQQEPPEPCAGGVPTVLNTDTIDVVFVGSDAEEVELRLGGGAFAPGVAPEADGKPEIEIQVSGEACRPTSWEPRPTMTGGGSPPAARSD